MLKISQKIRSKLSSKTPPVSESDILECFANRVDYYLLDTRAKNATTPPTKWFIAENDHGRWLKICFIEDQDGNIVIKTAYVPNPKEVEIYKKHGKNGEKDEPSSTDHRQ